MRLFGSQRSPEQHVTCVHFERVTNRAENLVEKTIHIFEVCVFACVPHACLYEYVRWVEFQNSG